VRSKSRKNRDAEVAEQPGMLQGLGWSNRDAVGFAVAASAGVLILVNTLFLQPGPHPAPMVRSSAAAITPPKPAQAPVPTATGTTQPRARVDDPAVPKTEPAKAPPAAPAAAPARPNTAVVADIQRELSRRGFYDGVVDGRYGPRTDAAIRDFEHAAGLRPSAEPNEALLRTIRSSLVRAKPALRSPAPIPQPKPDPIAEMISPSKQVIAVQRALSEFGYGQIKPTGIVDPETQSAIQKFERERKLPVTGQLSHRVVRELAGITGRPLE
jgi:peptidoglycan hydrolase-like protein with peptidoglycan-binding domain